MYNLFICYTPLHAMIAKRLIEKKELDNIYLIYICFGINAKHECYYSKLAELSDKSILLDLRHTMLSDVYRLVMLALSMRGSSHSHWSLYTGNIKHFHSRFLALLLGIKEFYTFDDGSGNISGDGYFYDISDRRSIGLLFKVLQPRLLYENVVKSIKKHYTIYAVENVYKNSEYIELISDGEPMLDSIGNRKVIYLSNAFANDELMTKKQERDMDLSIVKSLAVTDVLMHPRGDRTDFFKDQGVNVIDTDLIAEDYILHAVKARSIVVVGVYSTALLNLSSLEKIDLINVDFKVGKPLQEIARIFELAGVTKFELGV